MSSQRSRWVGLSIICYSKQSNDGGTLLLIPLPFEFHFFFTAFFPFLLYSCHSFLHYPPKSLGLNLVFFPVLG